MTLTYIFHSGFVLETEQSILVFDYWLDPSGVIGDVLKKDKPLYVFSSHFHEDHFTKEIFEWKKLNPDITYIISKETDDAELKAISATLGNAFKEAFIHYRDVNYSKEHLDHYTLSVCLLRQYFYTSDYKTIAPQLKPLNNFNEGYEKCDFHKLTGWGNWLNTNQQALDSNPQKSGGGKLE